MGYRLGLLTDTPASVEYWAGLSRRFPTCDSTFNLSLPMRTALFFTFQRRVPTEGYSWVLHRRARHSKSTALISSALMTRVRFPSTGASSIRSDCWRSSVPNHRRRNSHVLQLDERRLLEPLVTTW